MTCPDIPADTRVVVGNLSPIGERVRRPAPGHVRWRDLASGTVILQERTQTPVQINTFLTELDQLVSTVPKDLAAHRGRRAGHGFQDTRSRCSSCSTRPAVHLTATAALPQTTALIRRSGAGAHHAERGRTPVQGVQPRLREVAEQLKQSDPDIRRSSTTVRRPVTSSARCCESGPGLGECFANLRTVGELEPRQAGLRQFL
ncbi:hypothetical protein HBB16_06935 [Pseudonocardia sp. MCCB 268]|nr:hypothetical protein [Pseudonocardia cytotoxica]